MEIYVMEVGELFGEHMPLELYEMLTPERREKIKRIRAESEQRRSAAVGLLLEYGLRLRGYSLVCDDGFQKLGISREKHGKPCVTGTKQLFFNLSHSGSYAAAVFSGEPVGIDVERVRPVDLALAKRFFAAEEYAALRAVSDEHGMGGRLDREFIRLWTRKESYIKAVGEGMHLPLADFSVLSETVSYGQFGIYYLSTWEIFDDAVLSVCAGKAIAAQVCRISSDELACTLRCGRNLRQ